MASYCNKNGFTWVGMQRLADEKGVTIQAISKHIQELKQSGLIEETAKAYWGGQTPRTSTLRIIFDPSMNDDDVLARAGSAEQVEPISRQEIGSGTSSNQKVVDRSRVEVLKSTAAALIGEVLERYRGEGLTPPTGHALEREAAMLASMRARQGLSL